MSDLDQLARLVGAAALAVSSGSLAVSILTYRRGSPRPRVGIHPEINWGPGDQREYNILIAVTNQRPAAIQVKSVGLQAKGAPNTSAASLHGDLRRGPALPHKIDGFHAAEWRFRGKDVADVLVAITGRPVSQLRGVVELGNGSTIRSPWQHLVPPNLGEDLRRAVRELRQQP